MSDTKKELSQSKQHQIKNDIRLKDIEKLEKQKTLPMDSSSSHVKSPEAKEQRPSLSMNVAEHLLFLMKEVTKENVDPKTVHAACNCATQMINLMKLNLRLRDM